MKTTESGGRRRSRGEASACHRFEGDGERRHILTDTMGLLAGLAVRGAEIQGRDGAPALLGSIRTSEPWLRHAFADATYAGPNLTGVLERIGRWIMQIVRRSDTATGFEVRRPRPRPRSG